MKPGRKGLSSLSRLTSPFTHRAPEGGPLRLSALPEVHNVIPNRLGCIHK